MAWNASVHAPDMARSFAMAPRWLLALPASLYLAACSGKVASSPPADAGGSSHPVDSSTTPPDAKAHETSVEVDAALPACSSSCTGPCVDGHCLITLLTLASTPTSLAVDALSLYWTDEGVDSSNPSGSVTKIDLTALPSSAVPVTLASGQNQPNDIALAGANAYWVNQASGETFFDDAGWPVARSLRSPLLGAHRRSSQPSRTIRTAW
jgi:hypothetical protein